MEMNNCDAQLSHKTDAISCIVQIDTLTDAHAQRIISGTDAYTPRMSTP